MPDRIMYHGTTRTALRSVLKTGIMPRPPESNGSWPSEASQTGFVYLTAAHALHYAMSPTSKYRGDYAVLEISFADISESRLYPDEDYLQQESWPKGAHHNDPEWSLDITQQQHMWHESLRKLGNVAVSGIIPPTAITRYAIFSKDRLFWGQFYGSDSDRLITRYQPRKAELQENLSFFFDDVPLLKVMDRMRFDAVFSEHSPKERELLWLAVQGTQVVQLDQGKITHKTTRNLPLLNWMDLIERASESSA